MLSPKVHRVILELIFTMGLLLVAVSLGAVLAWLL